MPPGTFELLIVLSIPLVGIAMIISAISRARKKLSPESNPTTWTYFNELAGYFIVGILILVSWLAMVVANMLGVEM